MATHILGIRHHGPGSAGNVKAFLEELRPDLVLVEGPPEADALLQWANHAQLKPPVAILLYNADDIQQSVFYPFAEFSPEWQAIQYAKKNNIHVRFMDLPMANHFALENEIKQKAKGAAEKKKQEGAEKGEPETEVSLENGEVNNYALRNNLEAEEKDTEVEEIKRNPLSYLAEAAGYDDTEKWWEHMFEHRQQNEEVFEAVNEAMKALRDSIPQKESRNERLREAHMRKTIRQAEKEMFNDIAVICGAWHAPALTQMPKPKEDNDLLKGLPKVKVECTWIPWTYSRLSFFSGYGAGINSPGWYEHIWKRPGDNGTLWMARVAKLFREKQMDTSVAHVIEAVRLAEALASLRNLSKAGLEELNEATLSVLCNGESIMMQLVHDELIVSNKIGEVPTEIPKPPLQLDIERQQKRLRLPATADFKDYTLDLRKENDLERSVFLHRLQLLELKWGSKTEPGGKGTFKEQWRLQWDPALVIDIIDKGAWGNTAEEAASKYVMHQAEEAASLKVVCGLLESTIPAELPAAVEALIQRINNLSAASGDVIQLMEAIPPLVGVSRYGNVRKTDAELVTGIVTGMITRICVSLPAACKAVADDAAAHLLDLFFKLNEAVNLLQQEGITTLWQQTLHAISTSKNTAPVIAGYSTRLLADRKLLDGQQLHRAFYYAMSQATAPAIAAAWLQGFLKGSGTLLLIDENLWAVVNDWVKELSEDVFTQVLPLLRRTFANFTSPERRKLGEKVKQGGGGGVALQPMEEGLDAERGKKGLPVVWELLGLGRG
jgi:hypothetical protein